MLEKQLLVFDEETCFNRNTKCQYEQDYRNIPDRYFDNGGEAQD